MILWQRSFFFFFFYNWKLFQNLTNKGKESHINFIFPIQTVFQDNQTVDERSLLFIKVLKLLYAEGIIKLENYYFITPYEIMNLGTDHQLMLKPYVVTICCKVDGELCD